MNRVAITPEQSRAVQESRGQPVYLVDETGKDAALAIVRVELLKVLAGDDSFDISETYEAQEAALASVWNEPQLDEYSDQDGSPID